MTRWLVEFGYDGAGFAGWARQPGLRTVEGELRRTAVRMGLAPEADALGLEAASRTDRGVHARANLLVLESPLAGPSLLGALNAVAPDLWAIRAAPVGADFRVRAVAERHYRYLEVPGDGTLTDWRAAAALFRGGVDARNFGRGIAPATPELRPVRSVTVHPARGGFRIDVRARAFVWGMVRKIVAGLRAHAAGELSLTELQAAVEGRTRLTLPLAEPERLILWSVRCPGIDWTAHAPPRSVRPTRRLVRAATAAELRARVLRSIAPRVPSGRR